MLEISRFLKIFEGKEENVGNQHFLLFPQYFLHCQTTSFQMGALQMLFTLTLSQTSPVFYVSAVQLFWKHCGKRRICSEWAISPFPTVFSTRSDNFFPFSSNLELSSANCFSLEGYKFVVWERVNNKYYMTWKKKLIMILSKQFQTSHLICFHVQLFTKRQSFSPIQIERSWRQ